MAIVRHVSGFMRGNTTRTALYYSAKSIFEIRKKKGKKDCEVALLSCEKIIAVLVHFGGEWAGKGVT